MSLEIITLEVYFHFIYLSVYFLAPAACAHGASGLVLSRRAALSMLFAFTSEWTSARNSQAGVIYLFLECDHYFSDYAAPLPPQPERLLSLHTSENYLELSPIAFSTFFHCSRGLWAFYAREMVAGSHLVPPWFLRDGKKTGGPYLTDTQFLGLCP